LFLSEGEKGVKRKKRRDDWLNNIEKKHLEHTENTCRTQKHLEYTEKNM
jgi:hypothetical protein